MDGQDVFGPEKVELKVTCLLKLRSDVLEYPFDVRDW